MMSTIGGLLKELTKRVQIIDYVETHWGLWSKGGNEWSWLNCVLLWVGVLSNQKDKRRTKKNPIVSFLGVGRFDGQEDVNEKLKPLFL